VDALLSWLASLPSWALHCALAATAAIENIFPPFPADTVVAAGSFLAARGNGSLLGVAVSVWLGNVLGAMAMYVIGRRYGANALMKRLGGVEAEAKVRALYARHGLWALFISRFLPGVRAIVPPFAGALRIPATRVAVPLAAASAIWYGVIAFLGFRFGRDLETITRQISQFSRTTGAIAVAVVLAAAAVIVWKRRRRPPP
jgi:membrane protein DedA with SNARE-associated domain